MGKQGKKNSSYKLAIQFNTQDPRQRDAINFLGLCGYSKNKMLGIIVEEFVNAYGLQDADADYIKKFARSYDVIKHYAKRSNTVPDNARPLAPKDTASQDNSPKSENVPGSQNSKAYDKDKANMALSAFGL